MKHGNSTRLTVKEVLVISRPTWWITTAVPFMAGYFVTQGLEFSWPLAIGTLYFLIAYNLLMYGVNDVFDYESDIRNPRKTNVLARAKHKPLLWTILGVNLPFWLYFVLTGTVASGVFFGVIILMALTYSVKRLRFKEVPVLDSITSAFHYTSPFIFGVLFANGVELWMPAWLAFFLWAMGNHAFGAIQDIKPDKEAGISSIATKLGAERTLALVLALYLVAAVLPILEYGAKGLLPGLVLSMYIALAANTLPKRANPEHGLFRQSWHLLTVLNYVNGALVSIYLLLLARLT